MMTSSDRTEEVKETCMGSTTAKGGEAELVERDQSLTTLKNRRTLISVEMKSGNASKKS